MMPMNQSMMPYFMQMMGQGMGNGMPQQQNMAPQLPMAQPSQGAGHMPQPQQQQQQPGFFQNMTSSPTQMASGIGLMGQAGQGLNSAANGIGGMFQQGGMFGAANAALPAGGFGAAGAGGLTGAGTFLGAGTGAGAATGGLGLGAAGSAMAGMGGAGSALGASATGAAGASSMADILPFLFL